MASLGYIPDFSTARLYPIVVLNTCDDPRLLALWCHYAIWNPIDRALDGEADLTTWATRTRFTPEVIRELTATLIARALLMPDTSINWFILEQASREVVLPYSNELRRRAGIARILPTQGSLSLSLSPPPSPSPSPSPPLSHRSRRKK